MRGAAWAGLGGAVAVNLAEENRGLSPIIAAEEYALLVAARHRAGLPISTEDGQIAAIALHHELPLATRNGKDFARIEGLTILNPWA